MTEQQTEGWYGPPRSRKFHYFRNARSLCGKWMVFVADSQVPWGVALGPATQDCAACTKKLSEAAA